MLYPMKFIKTAQYNDATNNTRHLIFFLYFPWKSPIRLTTVMLQITDFLSAFFTSNFEWYSRWNSPKQLSTTMLQISHVVYYSHEFSMDSTNTARYQDATNNSRYPIFSRYFPWKSPKRRGTMMLQITGFIYIFHVISHEIHQNGSAPRCYK